MPPTRSSRVPPQPSRMGLWAAIAVALILASAVGIYLWLKPKPAMPASEPVATAPADTAPAETPTFTKRHLYSETADPKADIAAGLAQARREHKRVLLDFGGDWCGDCQVLDIYFHQPPNDALLANNFVVVHVWIGSHIDANLDVPEKYGVAIHKGVPALAVLAPNGSVVYAQKLGEFENMRTMDASSVTEFLNKWKS